jgi:hypothetical protein
MLIGRDDVTAEDGERIAARTGRDRSEGAILGCVKQVGHARVVRSVRLKVGAIPPQLAGSRSRLMLARLRHGSLDCDGSVIASSVYS